MVARFFRQSISCSCSGIFVMSKTAALMLATLVALPLQLAAEQQVARLVTACPEETDEILANPGIGWETFHLTSKQDKSPPAWLPYTVQYARWGWAELEP